MIEEYSTKVETLQTAEVAYLTNDHLGSPRINTDRDGDVTSRHDYDPFGEEIILTTERGNHPEYSPDRVRKQFTGYERDDETLLDYAGARHYNSAQGRFTSTDPILIKKRRLADPQQINLYLYVRNSPLKFVDWTGEDLILANSNARQGIQKLFAGMTSTERSRIEVSNDGRVGIRSCSGCSGSSSSAFKVVSDAVSAKYDIRLSLVKPGESVAGADGSTVVYQTVADAGGQAEEYSDGTWDVRIPDANLTVLGVDGSPISTDPTTMTPHELAHATRQDAVAVENAVRAENAQPLRLGDDHMERDAKGNISQQVTVTTPSVTPIEMRQTPLPSLQIQSRPLIPLKKPEN